MDKHANDCLNGVTHSGRFRYSGVLPGILPGKMLRPGRTLQGVGCHPVRGSPCGLLRKRRL